MRHNLSLDGHRFGLRPVVLEDAAAILALRLDPHLGRFLHATSAKLSDQEDWLRAYFERAGDYYFAIFDRRPDEVAGFVGIYDVDPVSGAAEWGRWLVVQGSLAAVESAQLIHRAAFDLLNLQALYSRTVAQNVRAVSFHRSMGAQLDGRLPGHVVLEGNARDSVQYRVDRHLWASLGPRLDTLARRIAEA
ncbi:GNAT family N-acetyltransferase [Phenylobacterium sp.]|uniref:GNAT family N-acetyltransferase n=1 Tax=Phenylobacterium sp. TaxID=1871053 RepID=UPI00398367F9